MAVQARRGSAAAARLAAIDHAPTRTAVALERALLRALGGGCGAACGAFAAPAGARRWLLHYGFAAAGATAGPPAAVADGAGHRGEDGRWRRFRLHATAAGCFQALAAWAGGEAPPGAEETDGDVHWSLVDEP